MSLYQSLIPIAGVLFALLAGFFLGKKRKRPPVEIDKTDHVEDSAVLHHRAEEIAKQDAALTQDVEVKGGAAQWEAVRRLREARKE